MDFEEKVLYHQIHPAKLSADIGSSLVSTCLMWRHKFVAAVLTAVVPAATAIGPGHSSRGFGEA